jgi:MSHA biogenesis protein MshI
MSWLNRKNREFAAVCVEAERICAVQVSRTRGARPTVTFSRAEAVAGEPAAALSRLKTSLHLQRFRCTTVMSPGTSRLVVIEAPKVPSEELREAVRWRLAEVIDYAPDSAVVDTLPITVDLNGRAHSSSVHVVAADRDLVDKCTESFRAAGLPLAAIDIPELALRNLASLFSERGSGVALAWFQPHGSGIVFVAGDELCISRQLDPTSADAISALETRDERLLDRITLGLQRSLDHFERNFSGVPIDRLLLAPFAGASGLVAHLGAQLSLPVELADFAKVLDLTAAPELSDPAKAGDMLIALGAALRSG